MKVLITAGGTAEPIDGVRRIANSSTGATGGVIARVFAARGHDVVLIHAADAPLSDIDVDREVFVTYADLGEVLRRRLAEDRFDAVIHLAAVSDYSVDTVEIDGRRFEAGRDGKIDSGHQVTIHLSPTPKLLDHLRSWSKNDTIQIVGFKLTNEPDPGERARDVERLIDRSASDLIVHNDVSEITGDRHAAEVWTRRGPIVRTSTKTELAEALLGLLEDDHSENEDS
ncbi:MAG: phosphopantothenoylcysteine decarboxylase [Candidatus Sulfomarinibacteraceae bacterium]